MKRTLAMLLCSSLLVAGVSCSKDAQPIRVGVEFLQGVGLRTDEAAAENVVVVAADADDLPATRADLEPTGRLAERADAIADSSMHAHGCSRDDRFVPGPDEGRGENKTPIAVPAVRRPAGDTRGLSGFGGCLGPRSG